MSETVFILGAGASAQAGAPVVRDFLDAAERLFHTDLIEDAEDRRDFELVARGRAALDAVHFKSYIDADDLEAVFGAFEMAAMFRQPLGPVSVEQVERLPTAIRRVIIRTLEELVEFPVRSTDRGNIVEVPRPYNQFLDIIKAFRERREPVSVITFNYDLALDYALATAGIFADYGLDATAASVRGGYPVQLLKLHGSLNWLPCTNKDTACGGIVALSVDDIVRSFDLFRAVGSQRIRISRALTHCPKCRYPAGEPRPVIVPPTWDKSHHHRQIEMVWRNAAHRLRQASRIIVIGYSLPPTDQFFRYLYALGSVGETRLQSFLVVNPDASVESRFRELLGRGVERRFMFRQWSFGGGMMHLARFFEGHNWDQESQSR